MKKLILAGLLAGGLALTACGSDKTQLDDAPVGVIDDSPSKILTNADSFPNVAVKCYGVNGLYTTTRAEKALIIVANDPQCGGDPQFTRVGN